MLDFWTKSIEPSFPALLRSSSGHKFGDFDPFLRTEASDGVLQKFVFRLGPGPTSHEFTRCARINGSGPLHLIEKIHEVG
jgi:hypothetical protein